MSQGPLTCFALQSVHLRLDTSHLWCKNKLGSRPVPLREVQRIFTEKISLADYHTIRHIQITGCGPPAVTGRWKDAREKVTFLVRSGLHIVPLSLLCTSFLGNISFCCCSLMEGSHADKKSTVPLGILGKSKSGKMLADRLLCCRINPFTHTLNQSCVDVPHPYP